VSALLTFQSLPVTLRNTGFNIPQFHMVIALPLRVVYESQNKQQLFPYTTLMVWFS
jgi:hypothetical protein